MFRTTMITLLAALLLLAGRPALADEESKREKVREKVKAVVMAKIIDELDLDEAGAQKLFPVLNKYQDQIAALHKDNGDARRELKKLLDADKVDDAKVNKQIDRIAGNHAKIATLEADMIKDVRKVLTASQSAKLVVILPLIRDRLEKRIRRAAQGGRGGRGGRGGGGGDKDNGDRMWDQLDLNDEVEF